MGTYRDPYIVKWLLQKVENDSTVWQRNDYGMYFANFNESNHLVRVEIGSVQARPSAVIIIIFASPGLGKIQIQEPLRNFMPFGKKYDSEDEAELAQNIKRLLEVIRRKNFERELKYMETEEERKQAIYNRLIGGNS